MRTSILLSIAVCAYLVATAAAQDQTSNLAPVQNTNNNAAPQIPGAEGAGNNTSGTPRLCGAQRDGRTCQQLYGIPECCSTFGQCGTGWFYCGHNRCISGPCHIIYGDTSELKAIEGDLPKTKIGSKQMWDDADRHIAEVSARIDPLSQKAAGVVSQVDVRVADSHQAGMKKLNDVDARATATQLTTAKRTNELRQRVESVLNKMNDLQEEAVNKLRSGFGKITGKRRKMASRQKDLLNADKQTFLQNVDDTKSRLDEYLHQRISDIDNVFEKNQGEFSGKLATLNNRVTDLEKKIVDATVQHESTEKEVDEYMERNKEDAEDNIRELNYHAEELDKALTSAH